MTLMSRGVIVVMLACLGISAGFAHSPQQSAEIAASQDPAKGLLSIFPDPPESNIYVNGNQVSEIPFTKELDAGTYEIRVIMAGWEEVSRSIEVLEHRRTIVSAQLLKPMPDRLTANDIGREEMAEFDFRDVKKPEVEPVFERPDWPKTGKRASLVTAGVGMILALTTIEGKNFADINSKLTKYSLAAMALGMTGFAVFYVVDDESGAWVEKENPDNIAFNRKKKAEIEDQNRRARAYNGETKRLLDAEYAKRTNEITAFNEGRGITVEVQ